MTTTADIADTRLGHPAPPIGAVARPARRRLRDLARSRIVRAIPTMALVAVAWFGFAPQSIGGPASYAITNGISMLPRFHEGDLVVLRTEPRYHVGEVAGYHNRQLGVVVMHRIVAIHGDHYVFRGDNNDFTDAYHPTKSQIVGAEWIHVPRLGKLVQVARIPAVAAVLLAFLWIASFSHERSNRHHRRRRRAH